MDVKIGCCTPNTNIQLLTTTVSSLAHEGKIQNSSFVLCDTQGSTFVHVYACSSCCVFTNLSMKIYICEKLPVG